jgi:hypothetical protein
MCSTFAITTKSGQELTNELHTIHYSVQLLPPSCGHTASLAPCSYKPSTYLLLFLSTMFLYPLNLFYSPDLRGHILYT